MAGIQFFRLSITLYVYPAKPTLGIRASKPDEFWHLNTTRIKLLDHTTVYLHAVIDNYSRRILAWCLSTGSIP